MSGWGGFIARTAVRKVVYVLVGLALAAVLAATGVRGFSARALTIPGTLTTSPGFTGNKISADFESTGGAITVTWATDPGPYSGQWTGVHCDSGNYGSAGTYSTGTHTWAIGTGTCFVYWYSGSFVAGMTGAGTYEYGAPDPTPTAVPDPTPTATPTAAPSSAPGLGCDPYCVVALTAEDRARLDDGRTVMVYGFGVVIFLGAVTAVAVGLRR